MSKIIEGLDKYFSFFSSNSGKNEKINENNFQIGENGTIEYSWSENISERIVQLNFQLTRLPKKDSIIKHKLISVTDDILKKNPLKQEKESVKN